MKTLISRFIFLFLCLPFLTNAQAGDALLNADSLRAKATNMIKSNELLKAISFAEQALALDKESHDSLGMAKSLYTLSRAQAFSGNFDEVIKIGESGSRLCRKLGDHQLELRTNNMLSWAYFETGKDFAENLKHQQRQVFLASLIDDDIRTKALVFSNYAYDSTVGGSLPLDDVIAYQKYANDFYAKDEGTQGRWNTLMNLTWQFRLKGDLGKSEEYGWKALNRAKKDENRHAIVEANTNLGETLLALGKTHLAADVYQTALEESLKEVDRDKYVFDVYYAQYLWETGQKDKATTLLENAIDFLTSSEVFYEMIGRASLASFYFETDEYEKALKQIAIIENPRSNYISFETKFKSAWTKYRILNERGSSDAIVHLQPYIDQAIHIGAKHLIGLVKI